MRRPGQATGGGGGVPRPLGAWERPGPGPDGCSAGCAGTAGAQGPGWDQRGTLFANPPARRARPSLFPWSRLLRGPQLLTCRVAAAPPLLLHLAAQTPAPPTAREDAGLEAPSPSPLPPPPRIPEPQELGAQRRSHRAAEGAAPSTGHPGLAPRLPSHPHHLAGLLVRWGRLLPVLRAPFCRQRPADRKRGRRTG